MNSDIKIIDAHMHFYSHDVFIKEQSDIEQSGESYKKGYNIWKEGFKNRFNASFIEDPGQDIGKLASMWESHLNQVGIDKACFLAVYPESDELTEFVSKKPDKFFAIATADPRDPDAALKFRYQVKEHGYRGLKLYPTTGKYFLSDSFVYPLYEEAQSLGVPVISHLGITLSYDANLAYANPIQLHAPARDFPDIQFIIPHFGAGYLRELFFLAYHLPNIIVDTSGTNRWIDYSVEGMSLERVFKKALFAFGPERIIFGSDSRMLSQGYRVNILEEQKNILNSIDLPEIYKKMILSENAQRLFKL